MSFYGSSFVFDGVASEIFDLRILDFSPANPGESVVGGEVNIYEQWLYRREVPYFYGRYYQSSLEFDFTVGSYSPIDGSTRNTIEAWLLGRPNYAPLRIVQDDISDIMFNVIIMKSRHIYIGNTNYALTLHAKCDRPWGIYYPPVLRKSYTESSSGASESFNYLNSSAFAGYNKPTVSFSMDSGTYGNSFSIINSTDGNREFRFDNLSPYEVITVDNDKGIITSSFGNLQMENFNKKFFRLIQGVNSLTLSGNITQFSITSEFARMVGA